MKLTPLPWPSCLLQRMEPQPNGCIWFTGGLSPQGYGRTSREGRGVLAHRAAYELFVGPIPEGMEVDHLCHSNDPSCPGGPTCLHRRCVNWEHLEPVNHATNVQRASFLRGRCDTKDAMGRKIADEPRKKPLCVRFTEAEVRVIDAKVGNRNRSDLLRRIVIEWSRREGDD